MFAEESERLNNEAFGANRLEGIENRQMLLNAANTQADYDDDPYLKKPLDDTQSRGPSQYYSARNSVDSNAGIASDGAQLSEQGDGLIQDAAEQQPSRIPGEVIQRRPSIGYSVEQNPIQDFIPRSGNPNRTGQARSNSVFGKYWRTFGERQAATGGGIGGFFKALFGFGMKRANQVAGARARRANERANEAFAPRSALRTRLANEGQARFGADLSDGREGLEAYPKEPGIEYDHEEALRTRRRFANARENFELVPEPAKLDAQRMMNVHARYDIFTGSRAQQEGVDIYGDRNEKFRAIVDANERAAASAVKEENDPHEPRPRLRNAQGQQKKVRFQDGADEDRVLETNGPDPDRKPRPSMVQFHAVPLTSNSTRGMTRRQQSKMTISDERAIANEQIVWSIRRELGALDNNDLEQTQMNASDMAAKAGKENPEPESAQGRELFKNLWTAQAGDEVKKHREHEKAVLKERREKQFFPANQLDKWNSREVLKNVKGLDESVPLDKQIKGVSNSYFNDRYKEAYDDARKKK